MKNNNPTSDSYTPPHVLPGLPQRVISSSYYLIIDGTSFAEASFNVLLGSEVRKLSPSSEFLAHVHLGSSSVIDQLFTVHEPIDHPLADSLLSNGFKRLFVCGNPTNNVQCRMPSSSIPGYLLDRLFPKLSHAGNTALSIFVNLSEDPTLIIESFYANSIVNLKISTLFGGQILKALTNDL